MDKKKRFNSKKDDVPRKRQKENTDDFDSQSISSEEEEILKNEDKEFNNDRMKNLQSAFKKKEDEDNKLELQKKQALEALNFFNTSLKKNISFDDIYRKYGSKFIICKIYLIFWKFVDYYERKKGIRTKIYSTEEEARADSGNSKKLLLDLYKYILMKNAEQRLNTNVKNNEDGSVDPLKIILDDLKLTKIEEKFDICYMDQIINIDKITEYASEFEKEHLKSFEDIMYKNFWVILSEFTKLKTFEAVKQQSYIVPIELAEPSLISIEDKKNEKSIFACARLEFKANFSDHIVSPSIALFGAAKCKKNQNFTFWSFELNSNFQQMDEMQRIAKNAATSIYMKEGKICPENIKFEIKLTAWKEKDIISFELDDIKAGNAPHKNISIIEKRRDVLLICQIGSIDIKKDNDTLNEHAIVRCYPYVVYYLNNEKN